MITERTAVSSDKPWLWGLYVDLISDFVFEQWGKDLAWQEDYFWKNLPTEGFIIGSIDSYSIRG